MVQVTQLFRQGVVRPLDESARDALFSFFVHDAIRCEWLAILDAAHFDAIWDSGLFQAIGLACDIDFSTYEEFVLEIGSVSKACKAVELLRDGCADGARAFAECLFGLLTDALKDGMPVMIIL